VFDFSLISGRAPFLGLQRQQQQQQHQQLPAGCGFSPYCYLTAEWAYWRAVCHLHAEMCLK
jgi:hypothetical protein